MAYLDNVQWLGDPGVLKLIRVKISDHPIPGYPGDESEPEGQICYLCRDSKDPLVSACSGCARHFHSYCNANLTTWCSECRNLCGKCLKSLSDTVACPYCRTRFHSDCGFRKSTQCPSQLCRLCVKDQLQSGIETCLSVEEIQGKLYHIVKFAKISLLHTSLVSEKRCIALRHSSGTQEVPRTACYTDERSIYGIQQFRVECEGDEKKYWEPREVIEQLELLQIELPDLSNEEHTQTEIVECQIDNSPQKRTAPISPQNDEQSAEIYEDTSQSTDFPQRQEVNSAVPENSQISQIELPSEFYCQESLPPITKIESIPSTGKMIEVETIIISDDDEEPNVGKISEPVNDLPPAGVLMAQKLLIDFGCCVAHPEAYIRSSLEKRRFDREKTQQFREVTAEIFYLAKENLNFTYSGIEINVTSSQGKVIQTASVHLFLLHKAWKHSQEAGILTNSTNYSVSFLGFPAWKPAYDNLIVALVLHYGLEHWLDAVAQYKPMKEWYWLISPSNDTLFSYETQVRFFFSQRLRFLIYCLVAANRC